MFGSCAAIVQAAAHSPSSSELIAIARAAAPAGVKFVLSRFEAFAPEQPFDAVFLTHTLEHLDEPVEMLRRIGSWLSPTGRLFVVVPNANAASRQIAVAMGLIAYPTAVTPGEWEHGHRRTYDLPALTAHVAEAGLRAVETGGVFFKPFANFQFDKLIGSGAIGEDYLEGCFKLGAQHPDMCASIYAICAPPETRRCPARPASTVWPPPLCLPRRMPRPAFPWYCALTYPPGSVIQGRRCCGAPRRPLFLPADRPRSPDLCRCGVVAIFDVARRV